MNLTPSQEKSIEQQKKFFSMVIYSLYTTNDSFASFDSTFEFKNMLGGLTEDCRSWTIGKRGKITKNELG